MSIGLVLVISLFDAARHADEADEPTPAEVALETALSRLSDLESPAGSRFFPLPDSRRELAQELRELQLHQ